MLLQIGMTSRYQNSPPDYTQNHAVVPLGAARTDHHLDTGLTVGCPVMRDRVKVKFPLQILKPASSRRLSNLGSRPRKARSRVRREPFPASRVRARHRPGRRGSSRTSFTLTVSPLGLGASRQVGVSAASQERSPGRPVKYDPGRNDLRTRFSRSANILVCQKSKTRLPEWRLLLPRSPFSAR